MKHGEELFDSKEYISDLGVKNIKYVPKDTLMLSFKLTLPQLFLHPIIAFIFKNILQITFKQFFCIFKVLLYKSMFCVVFKG
jgi:hypothetical protein